MTEIYLIRHCEAEGNYKRFFQGVIDTEITELGAKQLEFLAKRFEDVELDRIYASPLKRTMATARSVADLKGIEVIDARDFIEFNCGEYEGVPFDEAFKDLEFLKMWNERPQDFAPAKGEKQGDAYERIWKAVNRLAQENRGKKIAVATHGGVLRLLMCRLMFGDLEKLSKIPYADNTAVSLLRVDDDGNVELVYMNDSSHLGDELLPEYSRVPSAVEE